MRRNAFLAARSVGFHAQLANVRRRRVFLRGPNELLKERASSGLPSALRHQLKRFAPALASIPVRFFRMRLQSVGLLIGALLFRHRRNRQVLHAEPGAAEVSRIFADHRASAQGRIANPPTPPPTTKKLCQNVLFKMFLTPVPLGCTI